MIMMAIVIIIMCVCVCVKIAKINWVLLLFRSSTRSTRRVCSFFESTRMAPLKTATVGRFSWRAATKEKWNKYGNLKMIVFVDPTNENHNKDHPCAYVWGRMITWAVERVLPTSHSNKNGHFYRKIETCLVILQAPTSLWKSNWYISVCST